MTGLIEHWNKNWPEIWCGVRGGLPPFIFLPTPGSIGSAVPVFNYHVVNTSDFAADLEFLRVNGYETATADELLEHLQVGLPIGENRVVLTFDDGPLNLYRVAFPLLRHFGFTAVAFISPGLHPETFEGEKSERLCTWSEIEEMHRSGLVDVQSHTLEHRSIPRWPQPLPLTGVDPSLVQGRLGSARPLIEDLRVAKEMLENRLGKRVRHLAFPAFKATPSAKAVARRVGYHGLWEGVVPKRPWNAPGDPPTEIVRVSGEFVRRLPGEGRRSLGRIVRSRYASNLRRILKSLGQAGGDGLPRAGAEGG